MKTLHRVRCQCCDNVIAEDTNRANLPKSFVCPKCGVGQKSYIDNPTVRYSSGRNYPEGHFSNGNLD